MRRRRLVFPPPCTMRDHCFRCSRPGTPPAFDAQERREEYEEKLNESRKRLNNVELKFGEEESRCSRVGTQVRMYEDFVVKLFDLEIGPLGLGNPATSYEHEKKFYEENGSELQHLIVPFLEAGTVGEEIGYLKLGRGQPVHPVTDRDEMRETLDGFHNKGFLHGDVKPDNFVRVDGTVRLIDFELSTPLAGDDQEAAKKSELDMH